MKNKILVGIAAGMFAVATVFSFNLSNANGGVSDMSLDYALNNAMAQNSELTGGKDMTWDDVASVLNDWDSIFWGKGWADWNDTYNDTICDWVHAYCDNYDLTGDPVFDKTGRQTDDCDGQPNRC
jgi:hypothetical protein